MDSTNSSVMGAQSSQSRRGNEEGIGYTNLKHGLHVDYQTVGLFILSSQIFILSKHSFVLTCSEQHVNCVGMLIHVFIINQTY